MATAKKTAELSIVATQVLEALKNANAPMTLKEIKEIVPDANPAHLTALRTRELVNATETEVVVQTKRNVLAYSVKTE